MTRRPETWSWRLLRAGAFRLDGGGMFGVVPKVLWAKMVEPDELNRIPLQTNCLLLERQSAPDSRAPAFQNPLPPGEGRVRVGDAHGPTAQSPQRTTPVTRVLIETGFGDKWSDKDRQIFAIERRSIVDALREVNLTPADINLVIVSHLHFDHAAGLTRHEARPGSTSPMAVPTFPNARIVVQRREWEDALANRSTMTRTYLRDHLDPVADRMILVEGETEITGSIPGVPAGVSGITVWPVPGHTWGQQAIRFRDEHGVVAFVGDVVPTVNHVGLAFSIGYDMEPYTNMHTKRELLDRACREGWRLALDHEPGPHPVVRVAGHLEKKGQFALHPA